MERAREENAEHQPPLTFSGHLDVESAPDCCCGVMVYLSG